MALHASTVVVPIDFSSASASAINTSLEIVENPSQLYLIHVMLPLETMSPGVLLGDVTDASRTAKVTTALKKLAGTHEAADAHLAVTIGTPGLEIADYAQRVKADLIIIPSHGYHGLKRLFLGSVAERVLRHAPCRVLVLRRFDQE
ncbi:universal stress protein [Pirellulales bacterium]|jgi:nucleotide-binding universal stress UspA family protein|nr:universal stress protein [Pirellulales bacterium]